MERFIVFELGLKYKEMWSVLKGILHLLKDERVFKIGHLCRRNVK